MTSAPRLESVYEVLGEIGRGGFGVVHRARHRTSGELVALKAPLTAPDPELLQRMEREVRLARGLDHPALVRLRDLVLDRRGWPVLVYQLVEGEDLARVLSRGPLDPEEARALLVPLAGALDALHQQGLVHRDLKPGNVLLDRDRSVYLADFGLLRPEHRGQTLTATGIIQGTPEYLAPETLGQGKAGPAADRYALGCLVHEMLTGHPPYTGELSWIVAGHLSTGPIHLPLALEESHPGLEAWLLPMLERDPGARPESAAAWIDAMPPRVASPSLAALARGEGSGAATRRLRSREPSEERTALRPPGDREQAPRLPTWALALLTVLVGVGVGVRGRTSPDPSPVLPVSPSVAPRPRSSHLDLEAPLAELEEQVRRATESLVDPVTHAVYGPDDPLPANKGELEALLSGRTDLLDTLRGELPALSRLLRVLPRVLPGELEEELPGGGGTLPERLARLDRKFENAGLPVLFAPRLELSRIRDSDPASSFDEDYSPLLPMPALIEALGEPEGWTRVVVDALGRLSVATTRKRDEYQAEKGDLFPSLTTFPSANLWTLFRQQGRTEAHRATFYRHVQDLGLEARVVLLAFGEALAPEAGLGPRARRALSYLVRRLLQVNRESLLGTMHAVDPELLLGWPAEDPESRLVLGEVLYFEEKIRNDWGLANQAQRALFRSLFRDFLELPGGRGEFFRAEARSFAVDRLFQDLLVSGEVGEALALVRRFPHDLFGVNPTLSYSIYDDLRHGMHNDHGAIWTQERRRELLEILAETLEEIRETEGLPFSSRYTQELTEGELAHRIRLGLGFLVKPFPQLWGRIEAALGGLGGGRARKGS